MTSQAATLPPSDIPIFTTVKEYRVWREEAFYAGKDVGFVPTMGALHDGHLSLVKRSLAANDLTVVSIFVNPAQFAPHEDLATYPRTLPQDLAHLSALTVPAPSSRDVLRKTSAVFIPPVHEMYPSGISQDVASQQGTFVEVKGLGQQMEGRSRPTFFRGVATVVIKLFNIIQPSNAYFGQKDIQQALLLRRMVSDLLLPHPTPNHLHIIPTARDPATGLALSSRNAYLGPSELRLAPFLYVALKAAATAWDSGATKADSVTSALHVLEDARRLGKEEHIEVRIDYLEFNDPETFAVLPDAATKGMRGKATVLSGAVFVGRTRLIDNLVLGEEGEIVSN
ncbi:Pantoate-beta-alanine ligase [Vararia minispora EC-137]|uniref:Pantoate-beta-alanine ligase n=1 Tax=Vararia minispora EC-137 TaxID=1314806 RepID=A0ACB8QQI1_9AGAM|nr:Pantoate-beta-alanine ligase [Vararia minispora EC-137]